MKNILFYQVGGPTTAVADTVVTMAFVAHGETEYGSALLALGARPIAKDAVKAVYDGQLTLLQEAQNASGHPAVNLDGTPRLNPDGSPMMAPGSVDRFKLYVRTLSPENGFYYFEVEDDAKLDFSAYDAVRHVSTSAKWLFLWFVRDVLKFRKCDHCGKWLSPVSYPTISTYDGSVRLCLECSARLPQRISVDDYHGNGANASTTHPNFTLFKTGSATECLDDTMGFELEVAPNPATASRLEGLAGSRFDAQPEYFAIRDQFVHEFDGSVGGGMEFISQIHTYERFKSDPFVEILCRQATAMKACDANPCSGLHFHVGKKLLGADKYEQAKTCLKLLSIMTAYRDDFIRLSKREPERMGYCAFASHSAILSCFEKVKGCETHGSDPFNEISAPYDFSNDHSQFLNLRGTGPTIEFRFFKSTTDPVLFRHYAELVHGLCLSARKAPFEKIYSFKRAFSEVAPDTIAYFRKMGCFLHTIASDKKGETY